METNDIMDQLNLIKTVKPIYTCKLTGKEFDTLEEAMDKVLKMEIKSFFESIAWSPSIGIIDALYDNRIEFLNLLERINEIKNG